MRTCDFVKRALQQAMPARYTIKRSRVHARRGGHVWHVDVTLAFRDPKDEYATDVEEKEERDDLTWNVIYSAVNDALRLCADASGDYAHTLADVTVRVPASRETRDRIVRQEQRREEEAVAERAEEERLAKARKVANEAWASRVRDVRARMAARAPSGTPYDKTKWTQALRDRSAVTTAVRAVWRGHLVSKLDLVIGERSWKHKTELRSEGLANIERLLDAGVVPHVSSGDMQEPFFGNVSLLLPDVAYRARMMLRSDNPIADICGIYDNVLADPANSKWSSETLLALDTFFDM